jgi:serine/threonine protein kinase
MEWSMKAAALKHDPDAPDMDSEELAPGTRLLLGQYTIRSFVNSGGFGIVYLAVDSLDRMVVIKECFPSAYCRRIGTTVGARSRAQQDDFRAAVRHFVQEAVTLSQLRHPNIVKVHQVFEDNETAYMAMDHIEGYDLLQTVEGSAPPLKPKDIIAHLGTMLDALGYVHSQGLLHRDISPDNMIFDTATGQPVLIDFGASRKEVTRKSRAISGLRVVKDGYSPQEFYVVGSKQAPCSDLYALAASFYHLISGETPKTSQERLSAIASREGDPLRPLAGRFRAYPVEFLQAIDKAMAIFPRDRLQSVEEWRAMMGARTAIAAVPSSPPRVPSVPLEAEVAAPVRTSTPAPVVARSEPLTAAPQSTAAPEQIAAPHSAARQGPREILVASTAAILLLVGLLSLPGMLNTRDTRVARVTESNVLALPTAEVTASTTDVLPVVNVLQLPGGYSFEAVGTATGTMTRVAEIPPGAETTLQVGDVLLVYAATGETLGTADALREILQREFASGVSTYGFVVRRGTVTTDAEFRLGVAG